MKVYIPTHVSIAIGEAVLRSVVQGLGETDKGKDILHTFDTSLVKESETTESVTLNSLLDMILPPVDDDDSEEDDSEEEDSEEEDSEEGETVEEAE